MTAANAALRDALAAKRPAGVAGVIARMRGIVRALPPEDGVRAFTTLYLAVTEGVREHLAGDGFEDDEFVEALDVAFANLFFDALRTLVVGGGSVPRAWAPLFGARSDVRIAPLQFALAGMNAHINRDLPVALVETWAARGLEPRARSAQRRDYRRVNAVLAATGRRVKARLLVGPARHVDVALGELDDVAAMWKVERAREAAWVNGETLWTLRGAPRLGRDFLRTLDRMVGFAGRGLLRPLAAHQPPG